jgi:hypothetical protein
MSWVKQYDAFIEQLYPKAIMKTYEVVLHFSGSHVCYVSAPNEDEAIDVAYDELANMHQLDSLEVMDVESCEDSEDDEDNGF